MKTLKNYISILNWIDAKFSTTQLLDFKESDDKLTQLVSSLTKDKKILLEQTFDSVELALQQGYEFICSTSDSYPSPLKKVFSCPVPLIYKGVFNLQRFNLGVVGSRKPQDTTNDWLKNEFYEALAELQGKGVGLNVLSGGAYGVDQTAHKVSLISDVPTICFLPTGVNECYPKSLKPILASISESKGAVVSPFPPNFPIYKSNFYFRNKILVLLSDLVLIAEARRRSGTIMTANMAVSSGAPIVALPQAPLKNCLGSLDLIESGVPLIRCKKDLIFTINRLSL